MRSTESKITDFVRFRSAKFVISTRHGFNSKFLRIAAILVNAKTFMYGVSTESTVLKCLLYPAPKSWFVNKGKNEWPKFQATWIRILA